MIFLQAVAITHGTPAIVFNTKDKPGLVTIIRTEQPK